MHRLWQRYFWVLIGWLKLHQFEWRNLSAAEVSLAQQVFGDLIDYSKVKVFKQAFLPWQPDGIIMAPLGSIHLCANDYVKDFSLEPLSIQAVYIHEMTHIYQFQNKINVLLAGAFLQSAYYLSFKKYNPYLYRLETNKSFLNYNIEQQGEIAKDIFLNKIPNIFQK